MSGPSLGTHEAVEGNEAYDKCRNYKHYKSDDEVNNIVFLYVGNNFLLCRCNIYICNKNWLVPNQQLELLPLHLSRE